MKVLSVAGGATGSIKLSYTPEFIGIKLNGSEIGRITGTREGTGILVNLDNYGAVAFGQSMRETPIGRETTFLLPVANGYVNGGFFLELSNITGGGSDIEVFAFSTKKGTAFVSSLIDTAVANTSTAYERFSKLVVNTDTIDKSDIITHFYNLDERGQAVLVTYDEVRAVNGVMFNNQTVTGAVVDDFILWDNLHQEFKAVVIQPVNNVTMYLQRIIGA